MQSHLNCCDLQKIFFAKNLVSALIVFLLPDNPWFVLILAGAIIKLIENSILFSHVLSPALGMCWSPEPGTPLKSSTWVTEIPVFKPSPADSRYISRKLGCQQRSRNSNYTLSCRMQACQVASWLLCQISVSSAPSWWASNLSLKGISSSMLFSEPR